MYNNVVLPRFPCSPLEEKKYFDELSPYRIDEFFDSIYDLYIPETDRTALVHAYVIEQDGNTVKIKVVHDFYGVFKDGEIVQLAFLSYNYGSTEDIHALLKNKELIIKLSAVIHTYDNIDYWSPQNYYIPIADGKIDLPHGRESFMTDSFYSGSDEPLLKNGDNIDTVYKKLSELPEIYNNIKCIDGKLVNLLHS